MSSSINLSLERRARAYKNSKATINRKNVTATDTTAATGMPFDCALSAAVDSPAVGVTEGEEIVNVLFGPTEVVETGDD